MKRFFLVGSPRSGTTLLQSLIASHQEIITFPESHFFTNLTHTGRLARLLHVGNKKNTTKRLKIFLEECQEKDLMSLIPSPIIPSYYIFTNSFITILDNIANKHHKSIWLEKTPLHLHAVPLIERYVAHSKFIHIIRNGYDTINSQIRVSRRHPKKWRHQSLEYWVKRWKFDIEQSRKYLSDPNHFFIRYEQLIDSSEKVMNSLFRFMDCEYNTQPYNQEKSGFILDTEPWKNEAKQGIKRLPPKEELVNSKEREIIQNAVKEVDLSVFDQRS